MEESSRWWPAMSRHPAHTAPVMCFHVFHLALLLRVKRGIERGIRLGVSGNHLRGQVADRIGVLLDPGRVILLDCCLQVLVRRVHLIMERFGAVGSLGEDTGGL